LFLNYKEHSRDQVTLIQDLLEAQLVEEIEKYGENLEQVAVWNQKDGEEPCYVKNKPELGLLT